MHEKRVSMIFLVSQCQASDLELRRLVAITRARHQKCHISGCLFWTGHYLVHLLEGSSVALGLAVRGLCRDGRQSGPKILLQRQVDLRHFNSSAFAFVPVTEFDQAVGEAYGETGDIFARRILLDFLVQEHAQLAFGQPAFGQPAFETG